MMGGKVVAAHDVRRRARAVWLQGGEGAGDAVGGGYGRERWWGAWWCVWLDDFMKLGKGATAQFHGRFLSNQSGAQAGCACESGSTVKDGL